MAKDVRLIEEGLIQEIVFVADEYRSVRDNRMALNKRESELKQRLIDVMHKHRRDFYSYEGWAVEIVQAAENVKVSKAGGQTEEA